MAAGTSINDSVCNELSVCENKNKNKWGCGTVSFLFQRSNCILQEALREKKM
jgi:hypothetical protein